uniref:Uncharacterized protein n=1 Tax=Cucumis melo TaxID=3656 RepID=A0A9I9EFP1_CUCME
MDKRTKRPNTKLQKTTKNKSKIKASTNQKYEMIVESQQRETNRTWQCFFNKFRTILDCTPARQTKLSAHTAKEEKLNFTAKRLQMCLIWRWFLGGFGHSAKNAKGLFTKMSSVRVETVLYFIEERRHKKTWLKLNSNWNVGISNIIESEPASNGAIESPNRTNCWESGELSYKVEEVSFSQRLSGKYQPCGWKSSDSDGMDPCHENVDEEWSTCEQESRMKLNSTNNDKNERALMKIIGYHLRTRFQCRIGKQNVNQNL